MLKMSLYSVMLITAALTIGCDDDDDNANDIDAAISNDAAVKTDAETDSAVKQDATINEDSAIPEDAELPADAEVDSTVELDADIDAEVDSTVELDSDIETDSTLTEDALVEEDAATGPCAVAGCEQVCIPDGDEAFCTCHQGFTLNDDQKTCRELTACDFANCEQLCTVNNEVAVCGCRRGYNLNINGYTCDEIDYCADADCAQTCSNVDGAAQCGCNAGYALNEDQKSCDNVDECAQETNPCGPGDCVDTDGSYACPRCNAGYEPGTGANGLPACVNINECLAQVDPCLHGTCQDIDGGYQCINCTQGYAVDDETSMTPICADIDECDAETNPCGGGYCTNTEGSYTCDCPKGYTPGENEAGNPTCIDIDECQREENPCGEGTCINTVGAYTCDCGLDNFLAYDDNNDAYCNSKCRFNETYTRTDTGYTCYSPHSDITFVYIQGATFTMGSDEDDPNSQECERPAIQVTVPDFEISQTEITVAQYAKSNLTLKPIKYNSATADKRCNWDYPGINNSESNYPLNCFSFSNMKRYFEWAQVTAPTEAQWELAARGVEGRTYPWGDEAPDCTLTNYTDQFNVEGQYCVTDNRPEPVCSHPSGNTPEGLCDMAGNVYEHTLDVWMDDHTYYAHADDGAAETCDDPLPETLASKCKSHYFVLKGGSSLYNQLNLRSANRLNLQEAEGRPGSYGFRVARKPLQQVMTESRTVE